MDSETPIIRLIAGAVGVVILCFCVGFFLLGPRGGSSATVAASVPLAQATPSPLEVRASSAPQLSVVETTERKPQLRTPLRVATDRTTEASPAPSPRPALKPSPAPDDTAEGAAAGSSDGKPGVGKSREKSSEGGVDPIQLPAPGDAEGAKPDKSADGDAATAEAKPADGGAGTLYRVRVKNSFSSHDDADQLASELKGRGFPASVMPAGKGRFQVQIGAYKDRKGAEAKQKELAKNNYDTHIADKPDSGADAEKPGQADDSKKSGDDPDKESKKEKSGGQ